MATPFTAQVTIVFAVPITDAVKLARCPAATLAEAGDTDMAIAVVLTMVTVADAFCVPATA